eukprot:1031570-Amphidinium_carterae.1
MPASSAGIQAKRVHFGTTIAAPAGSSVRTPTPAPQSKGNMCMLHITGFATPLDHREMSKFAHDELALPSEATVITRGYYSQRATL